MATTAQPESVRQATTTPVPAPTTPGTAARRNRTVVAAARLGGQPPLFPGVRPAPGAPPTVAVPATDAGASTATDHPGADPAGAVRPAPRAQRLPLPLPLARIVCWQLALVLGAGAVGRDWPAAVALGGSAGVLLAVTAIRVRGTWLSTLLGRRSRLLLRRRAFDLPAAEGSAALLALLLPGARIDTAEIGGDQAGIVSRADELVAVLRPARPGSEAFVRAVLAGAVSGDGDPDAPRLGLHLVLHRGPQQVAPRAWLAVRVLRDVDAAEDSVLRVTLGNAVRRLRRRLRHTGLDLTVVPERELLATLTSLTHTGPGREAIREHWHYWRAGPVTQIGLRMATVGSPSPSPSPGPAEVLEQLLDGVRDVAVTVAVVAGGTELSGVLRIAAATPEAAQAAVESLTSLGPDLGVHLERLDGLHGPAVTASLPIGGAL
ncbi:type VII secretion protein EccE [Micromonospora pisi]|uniref:Type VII secretion protein EccE n=1 Tax=Micromonospora pisi TaxID=589240 RepID=A0A495JU80_9ACTN|nr:type VII secretion protein EccE [Micromonospora pisi]RKR91882.1 type VII secretion protein EccE [Micromonospora pisi]